MLIHIPQNGKTRRMWLLTEYFGEQSVCIFLTFYFEIVGDLQKSYKNSTKNFHILFT